MSADKEYMELRQAGFSEQEVHEHFSQNLVQAGFADQEVSEFLYTQRRFYNDLSQQSGVADPAQQQTPEPGFWDSAVKGFAHSTTGLRMQVAGSNSFKDQISDEASAKLPWYKGFVRDAATMAGDLPDMAAGAMAGTGAGMLAGPAAPAAVPLAAASGAFGAASGMRAVLMDQLKNGNIEGYEDFSRRIMDSAHETTKGMAIGAATYAGGAVGKAAATAVGGVGATAAGQAVGHFGGEMVGLMGATGATEGRIPEASEWTSAATLIIGMRLGTKAAGTPMKVSQWAYNKAYQDVLPKMRDIYQYTGKTPAEVVQAAKSDPSIVGDLLSQNKRIPEKFAQETLERVKSGQDVPLEELQGYADTNWGKAAIAEKSGPEYTQEKISSLYDIAEANSKEYLSEPWAVVRLDESKAIKSATGLDIEPGFTHRIDTDGIKHALKNHGDPATEISRGQVAISREDFLRVPEIIMEPDAAPEYVGKNYRGNDVIRYEKTYDDGTTFVVEEAMNKRKQLALQTMYKRKPQTSTDSAPPSVVTSETTRDMTPVGDVARINKKAVASSEESIRKNQAEVNTDGVADAAPDTLASMASRFLPNVERTGKTPEQPVSISGIIEKLSEALDVPVRVGKLGPSAKDASGIYKINPEVIRTRVANNISTVAHEIGHHLEKILTGEMTGKLWEQYRHELEPIATMARKGQDPITEGFAEFVRLYVTNPEEAVARAPKFLDFFDAQLKERAPEMHAVLTEAKKQVRAYLEQPAVSEILSHISFGKQQSGVLSRLWSTLVDKEQRSQTWEGFKERVTAGLADRLNPLRVATEELAKGNELPFEQNPYILARLYAGAAGKAEAFIERAPFSFGTLKNVEGVRPLRTLFEEARQIGSLQEFSAYLVARRSLELGERGIRAGVRMGTAKEVVQQLGPRYEALGRDLLAYQDALVRYMVDSGVLDARAAKQMRKANQHYVPFQRVMEASGEVGGLKASKSFSARNIIKRIKGSGRDIVDPLESILANTYTMIDMAEKNSVGRALVELARKSEGSGWLIEELPTPKKPTQVRMADVLRRLEDVDPEAYAAIESMTKGPNEIITLFSPSTFIDKKNQITVMEKGKRKVYQVSPEIAEVMNNLGAEHTNWVIRLLALPARTLRAGAVLSPDFMARNAMRDALESAVKSESDFRPGIDTVYGFREALKKSDLYWEWKKSGGDQASFVSMDRTTLVKTMADMEASGVPRRAWNLVKNPMEGLRILSELSEEMTRVGEYRRARQQLGESKDAMLESGMRSRDVSMDFARMGAKMQAWNMLVPFTNAQIQSLWRTGEAFKKNPGKVAFKAFAYITAPSLLVAWLGHDDEDIKELPAWQRDLFWCIKMPWADGKGDTIWRIPKPFEVGVIFGSLPERMMHTALDLMKNDGKKSAGEIAQESFRGTGKSLVDLIAPRMTPTFAMPFIQSWANKSLFTDRPIIPADREGMLPEYQYTPYTTEFMKKISQVVGSIPAIGQMKAFSPAMGEQLVRDWTGGLGTYALQITDFALRKAGALSDPVRPANTVADIPVIRSFVARNPSMGAESINRWGKNWEEAQKYLKTITGLQKELKYEDIEQYLPYQVYKALEGPQKALNDIRKMQRMIWQSPYGTPDEKRQMLETLTYQAIEIAKQGNEVFDMLKDGLKEKSKAREKVRR